MSTPTPSPARSRLAWVPIRALAARHRPRILRHLLALDERDRYLRFGYAASDEQVEHYVDGLDFERDEIFGIFNRRLDVVAMAHLAYEQPADEAPAASRIAEFGVSVSASSRGRGFGARLFDHAVLHARNRGIDTLTIYALSENTAMLRIARNGGAIVSFEGPDALAHLKLPPEDLASHVEAMVGDQAAEFDYSLKVQARRLDAWLNLFSSR
jgi:ribosomal protein S18 acetylase RimI-like enzyme